MKQARFLSLAGSKSRLCSANHRPGYWSNLPCDWPSTVWAYSEQETENRPSLTSHDAPLCSRHVHIPTDTCRNNDTTITSSLRYVSIWWRHHGIFYQIMPDIPGSHLRGRQEKRVRLTAKHASCATKYTDVKLAPDSVASYFRIRGCRNWCQLLVGTNMSTIRSSDNDSTGFWPPGSLHTLGADGHILQGDRLLCGLNFFALNIFCGEYLQSSLHFWCCKYGENRYCEICSNK